MKVAKIFQADVPNSNGVIYPLDELETAADMFNSKMGRFAALGHYPPETSMVNLANVAATVELVMSGDIMAVKIGFLNTANGKIATQLYAIGGLDIVPVTDASYNSETKVASDLHILSLTLCHLTGERLDNMFEIVDIKGKDIMDVYDI